MARVTYSGITVTASAERPSSREDKKFMREVTYQGNTRLVHYGDPNMEIQSDNDERRAAFVTRHSCDTKRDPFSPGFWSCYKWTAGRGKSAEIDETDNMASKAGRRNNRTDRQRIDQIKTAATQIVTLADEMEPATEDSGVTVTVQAKAVQIDPMAHPGAMVALMLTPEQQEIMSLYRVGDMADSEADHITLLYLADDANMLMGVKNEIIECLACIAKECMPVTGNLNGHGVFSAGEAPYPIYANYDSPNLFKLRAKLLWKIEGMGIELPNDHGFTPHLTLGYLSAWREMPPIDLSPYSMDFGTMSLIWGGERIDFVLAGQGEDYEEDEGEDGKVEIEINVKGQGIEATTDAMPVISGVVRAVKADGGAWVLEVLGVPFGGPNNGRDSDGEYFSAKTNVYADRFPVAPAIYFHGYDENNKPSSEPQYIGAANYSHVDSKGHWYKVVLDKASAYAQRVWQAAKQGIARASSGSITHLVRKESGGHITHWPVAELSIFDAVGARQPANQYAVALPVMKAVWTQAGMTLPADIETDSAQQPEDTLEGAARTAAQSNASAKANGADVQQATKKTGVLKMEQDVKELVAQSVAEAMKAQRLADDEARKAEKARQDEIKSAADAAAKAVREAMQAEFDTEREAAKAALEAAKAEAAEARRLPDGGDAPYVAKFGNIWKYDNLGIDDLAFAAGVLDAAKGIRMGNINGAGASENMRKALAVRLAETKGDEERQYVASKMAMKSVGMSMKSDELNRSTLASYGDEWIGVTYSAQLWDKVRLQTPVAAQIPTVEVPQGSESIVIPVLGSSPTFYKMAQAADQASNPGRVTPTATTSRLNTANKTLTVGKLGAAINYTGELEEDSFVPWVSELRADIVKEAAEVLEHVIIDGDTATGATTNINHIGGTPTGNEAFLLFDGFRKLALVTNTANSRSAGTLDLEDYLETLKLMGLGGRNAADKARVAFITDMHTHWKSMTLAELKTRDVFMQPTIESGMLTSIYGTRVFASPNMHRANGDATYGLKANSAGKVDQTTAANNLYGAICAVRFDQWRLGYKRRWVFEVQRDAISDSTVIVGTMRVGMVNRDTEASAVSYNVTVA